MRSRPAHDYRWQYRKPEGNPLHDGKIPYAHDRNINAAKQSFNFAIVKVSNHTIAQPVFDIVDATAEIFFNKNIPITLGSLQVFAHSLDNLAVIRFVGIE